MSKSFSNVIILVFWLAGGFAGFAPLMAAAGIGQILFPLGTGLAVGLLGIGLVFGKRATPFDGLWAPLNLNLLAIFVALGTVVAATLGFGLRPFVDAVVGDAASPRSVRRPDRSQRGRWRRAGGDLRARRARFGQRGPGGAREDLQLTCGRPASSGRLAL